MKKNNTLFCDGCNIVLCDDLGEQVDLDGCYYALCISCGLKSAINKRNKLNRRISELKKANLS